VVSKDIISVVPTFLSDVLYNCDGVADGSMWPGDVWWQSTFQSRRSPFFSYPL